ncbi:CHASE2 domain-containing protein [Microcoleus sp. FACHB-831]|uniref:CHASE2 domain-containing protein n=1 Tax=Microcoleus sp. FACHB-831 TaxID=2692827 RepID=UPI001688E15E|nr:CHASE2 domain-containing protein [Microcoleus sp. FACHB-831]MBD1923475.1 CHASE2 domain-containing protein [Microcoleus sp. FACHB-831]
MTDNSSFRLKVQRIDKTCLFELSWGRGQQLCTTLNYPETLTGFYQEWQRVYLSFYKSALRGRVEGSGSIASPPIDWHARLVQAEARLLYEFHHWLRSAELYEIRAAIAKGTGDRANPQLLPSGEKGENVFLTCNSIELARLPWEAWEIGAEFATSRAIRIVRAPLNIKEETLKAKNKKHGKKARVLVILGDDTGLNFQKDREAVRSLSRIAEIKFVGWQPGQDIAQLKDDICQALTDERGWDVLLFAGHSNESAIIGGELAIAPNTSLSISEIELQLQIAKSRGLQFALFNSCSGINIAESLINLGFSQVAIMREPIHNEVAQKFIKRFMQTLAERKDVQESMLAACQYLKLEENFTCPSASLIPSLFCHPDADLFRIPPSGIKQIIDDIVPTMGEAIALSALLLISLSLSAQNFLVDQRVLTQAIYRHLTNQLPNDKPPVLLVQINEKSIQEAKIRNPKPMDRKYLASLVDKLSAMDARVVGIDYLLDRKHGDRQGEIEDARLARSLQAAVKNPTHPTWFVFAMTWGDTKEPLSVHPSLASNNWSLQGNINVLLGNMKLIPAKDTSKASLSFSYMLALAYKLNCEDATHSHQHKPQPQLQNKTDFFSEVTSYLREKGQHYKTLFPPAARLQPITSFSYKLRQKWLHPIIDFSIPPDRVYNSIPAWKLLQIKGHSYQSLKQQVAIVVPWGYGEAGVSKDGEDNWNMPPALSFWLTQGDSRNSRMVSPGGESHAYMVHHLLKNRLVVPIPDLWAIAVALILGKGTALIIGKRQHYRQLRVILPVITPPVYGIVCLQIYISSAILLPWFLPSVAFGLPMLLRKRNYA